MTPVSGEKLEFYCCSAPVLISSFVQFLRETVPYVTSSLHVPVIDTYAVCACCAVVCTMNNKMPTGAWTPQRKATDSACSCMSLAVGREYILGIVRSAGEHN